MLDITLIFVILLTVIIFKKKIVDFLVSVFYPLKNSATNLVDFKLANAVVQEEQKKNKKSISYVFTIIGGYSIILLVLFIFFGKNEMISLLDIFFRVTVGDLISMDSIINSYKDTFVINALLIFIQNMSVWFIIGFALSFIIKPLSIVLQLQFILDKVFQICVAFHILSNRFRTFTKVTVFVSFAVTIILVNVFKHK